MIQQPQFDITKFPPVRYDKEKPMTKIRALDTEAYTNGKPFMFCTDIGDTFRLWNMPLRLFSKNLDYINSNIFVYNMKYESGALLYNLPIPYKKELAESNKVYYQNYFYRYIPHKHLRIEYAPEGKLHSSNPQINFWDISQFYHMSLDNAAHKYLGERKMEMETKEFTTGYVKKEWQKIKKYCIRDAALTKRLAVYFLDALKDFDIEVSKMYSCASISQKYFKRKSDIISTYDIFKYNKRAFSFGCESYSGGKFEAQYRGKCYGYIYDFKSAYPYEMIYLRDIKNAHYWFSRKIEKDAHYSFFRCRVYNEEGKIIPFGPIRNGVRIYPKGIFYHTITLNELLYCHRHNIPVQIIEALHIRSINPRHYPYRKPVMELYKLKDAYKGDKMRYMVTKILMNSFYGKMVQALELPDKSFLLGECFNQFYGSIITANTRVRIAELQQKFQHECLAVHTDSVIMTKPISKKLLSTKLGGLDYEGEGDGYIVACGQYEIGKKLGSRSVDKKTFPGWKEYLTRYYNDTKIPMPQVKVTSWVEAMAKGKNHFNKINLFENVHKNIDLNKDEKRIWPRKLTGKDLLNDLHESKPVEYFNEKPSWW